MLIFKFELKKKNLVCKMNSLTTFRFFAREFFQKTDFFFESVKLYKTCNFHFWFIVSYSYSINSTQYILSTTNCSTCCPLFISLKPFQFSLSLRSLTLTISLSVILCIDSLSFFFRSSRPIHSPNVLTEHLH